MKILLSGLLLICLLILPGAVSALTLDMIGSSSVTNGDPGTEWWYTNPNPLLSGTAAAGSSVTVTVDGVDYATTANESGNWQYQLSGLETGDYQIGLAGDGENISFTLHAGQSMDGTETESTGSGELPQAGSVNYSLLFLAMSGILVAAGFMTHRQFQS